MAKKRLVLETQNRKDCYELPEDCGKIIGVDYRERLQDECWLLFPVSTDGAFLRVYAIDKPPETPEEARNLLRRAYTRITYKPVWIRWNDRIYVYPAPVNDGDYLILTIDEDDWPRGRMELRGSQVGEPAEDRCKAEAQEALEEAEEEEGPFRVFPTLQTRPRISGD